MTTASLPTAAHTASADAVASALDVHADVGLGHQQGVERLAKWGPNALPVTPPRSPWRVLLAQFKSVMIVILLGAALLAAWVGSIKDASVILAVVIINALVGFYQAYRAERSLDALKSMLPANATVRRDGSSQKIDAEAVVPGDILLLELGDRSNMVYMNTLLTRGRAEVLVTATGSHTEMGKLSRELADTVEVPTPLQLQLDQLAKRLGAIALTLVALLSLMQFLRGKDLPHILLDAIALAVAAMPEGLPVVVTVTLALGMHKMARQHAIVKRLASVETLGCTTVICSDKTGTLTLNQMTATTFGFQGRMFEVSGEGYDPTGSITEAGAASAQTVAAAELIALLQPLVACNDSRIEDGKVIGDPMEAALLVLAAKGGVVREAVERALPRVAELPFDSAHKFMATFHADGEQIQVFVKGAPDVLLARCSTWRTNPHAASHWLRCDRRSVSLHRRVVFRGAGRTDGTAPCRSPASHRRVPARRDRRQDDHGRSPNHRHRHRRGLGACGPHGVGRGTRFRVHAGSAQALRHPDPTGRLPLGRPAVRRGTGRGQVAQRLGMQLDRPHHPVRLAFPCARHGPDVRGEPVSAGHAGCRCNELHGPGRASLGGGADHHLQGLQHRAVNHARKGVLNMKICLSLATIWLMSLSASVQATPLCRWVDRSGRTQIAEVVPEKYRRVAVCTDSQKYELSAEQRQAAEQRVADDRARAREAAANPPSDRASSAPRPTRATSRSGTKRPTEVVTADTDCTTWWRIYDESVECFGPYRTTRGATKPEGFDRCNVVASPEPRCGPRSKDPIPA